MSKFGSPQSRKLLGVREQGTKPPYRVEIAAS